MAIDVGLDATDPDASCEYTRHRDEIPTGTRLTFGTQWVKSGLLSVTFIVGTPPETASLWLRITSATEGFLGAFFIALFVFTLTRTVHR